MPRLLCAADEGKILIELRFVHAVPGIPIRHGAMTSDHDTTKSAPDGRGGVLVRQAARMFAERCVHMTVKENGRGVKVCRFADLVRHGFPRRLK